MPDKIRQSKETLTYREAEPADSKKASRLLFSTFPRVATYMMGLGSEEQAVQILERIFKIKGHRFSYEFTEMALLQGKVIGLILAYPGQMHGKLDMKLGKVLLQQYRLRGKIALILRALPLIFIQEVKRDEYLLSNLAVTRKQRGQGWGTQMLAYIDDKARHAGYAKIALRVHIENEAARRLYQREGYQVKAIDLESNRRVSYLGSGYRRMVKTLSHE